VRFGFVASGCVDPVEPTVAGYDWLAELEVTVEPVPVAGFATCALPVCVPVTLWGPTLPPVSCAIQVVAITERQNATPTTEDDFHIENILFPRAVPQERCTPISVA
jgi:hypothetical protein